MTAIGELLKSRYLITELLSGGGFSVTYLAEDTHMPDRPVCVVKQLTHASKDENQLENARKFFFNEAQTLRKLGKTHDQIPELLAYFTDEGSDEFYIVQEFISGKTLKYALARGEKLSETEVLYILKQTLEILVFVHSYSVIHLDIKPDNLILREADSRIVLIDFGSVKQARNRLATNEGLTPLTITLGTPGYMPCEQSFGRPKLSSDFYALGMFAIQALTGVHPKEFPEDPTTGEILWEEQTSISREFKAILHKMVRYHFNQRYQSATEILADIANLDFQNADQLDTCPERLIALTKDSPLSTPISASGEPPQATLAPVTLVASEHEKDNQLATLTDPSNNLLSKLGHLTFLPQTLASFVSSQQAGGTSLRKLQQFGIVVGHSFRRLQAFAVNHCWPKLLHLSILCCRNIQVSSQHIGVRLRQSCLATLRSIRTRTFNVVRFTRSRLSTLSDRDYSKIVESLSSAFETFLNCFRQTSRITWKYCQAGPAVCIRQGRVLYLYSSKQLKIAIAERQISPRTLMMGFTTLLVGGWVTWIGVSFGSYRMRLARDRRILDESYQLAETDYSAATLRAREVAPDSPLFDIASAQIQVFNQALLAQQRLEDDRQILDLARSQAETDLETAIATISQIEVDSPLVEDARLSVWQWRADWLETRLVTSSSTLAALSPEINFREDGIVLQYDGSSDPKLITEEGIGRVAIATMAVLRSNYTDFQWMVVAPIGGPHQGMIETSAWIAYKTGSLTLDQLLAGIQLDPNDEQIAASHQS